MVAKPRKNCKHFIHFSRIIFVIVKFDVLYAPPYILKITSLHVHRYSTVEWYQISQCGGFRGNLGIDGNLRIVAQLFRFLTVLPDFPKNRVVSGRPIDLRQVFFL